MKIALEIKSELGYISDIYPVVVHDNNFRSFSVLDELKEASDLTNEQVEWVISEIISYGNKFVVWSLDDDGNKVTILHKN